MARKVTTYEMVELYIQGETPRRISEIYGISASAVGERLKRMGYLRPYRRLQLTAVSIDSNHLKKLYTDERLSCARIAAECGVSVKVIRQALKLYGIPKRPPLCPVPTRFAVLQKLKIGDSAKILYRDEKQVKALLRRAQELGIFIEISLDQNRRGIEIMRVSVNERQRLSDIKGINRAELEAMYRERKLSAVQIGRRLNLDAELIRQALVYYRIPNRFLGNTEGGKYTNLFRSLQIGETGVVECAAKYPYVNLHSIAVRLGMKISMRRIVENRYQITRLL